MVGFARPAQANLMNLVSNGSFESFTPGGASGSCTTTQTVTDSNLPGWGTTSGYSFVINSGTYSSFCGVDGALGLYGPIPASPDGGNFLAGDGAYMTGYTYQTITGLVPGASYIVSFDMAAAQQSGYSGATSDYWQVGLGSSYGAGPSVNSTTINLASGAFSGWIGQQVALVAGATTEVLWFFAVGTPSGQPPFALLDGVGVMVPEPSAAALLGMALIVAGGALAAAATGISPAEPSHPKVAEGILWNRRRPLAAAAGP